MWARLILAGVFRTVLGQGAIGGGDVEEKALALPNPEEAPAAVATTLPLYPASVFLDLLRAADAAVVAGELARARSLIAAAAAQLDAEKAEAVSERRRR